MAIVQPAAASSAAPASAASAGQAVVPTQTTITPLHLQGWTVHCSIRHPLMARMLREFLRAGARPASARDAKILLNCRSVKDGWWRSGRLDITVTLTETGNIVFYDDLNASNEEAVFEAVLDAVRALACNRVYNNP